MHECKLIIYLRVRFWTTSGFQILKRTVNQAGYGCLITRDMIELDRICFLLKFLAILKEVRNGFIPLMALLLTFFMED